MVFKRKSKEELEKDTAYYAKRNEERAELAKARQEHRRTKYKRVIATSQKVYSGATNVGRTVTTQPKPRRKTYKIYKPATTGTTGVDRNRARVRRAKPRRVVYLKREQPVTYVRAKPKRRKRRSRRSSSSGGMFDLPRF